MRSIKTLVFLAALTTVSVASVTQASSFVVTTDALVRAIDATTDTTSDLSSSLRDNKLVQQARDDAASFVASDGAIRGVRLESALAFLREQLPQVQATDTQWAEAIIAG
ncbi:DUF2388 domain-containing protein [Pseudomonas massiliensis]|uniref:DUF2388 domain-containing protein n=1 Tax=Pseudomonas massiliensis TaxID=522492 RepID=UPI00058DD1A3|nr:DUF2388 domain-containing protein [Pseudomonas massiliensis]